MYVNWQTTSKEKLIAYCGYLAPTINCSARPNHAKSPGPGKYVATTWDIPVGVMPAGIYRVDLILNDKTAWRDFFRITDKPPRVSTYQRAPRAAISRTGRLC